MQYFYQSNSSPTSLLNFKALFLYSYPPQLNLKFEIEVLCKHLSVEIQVNRHQSNVYSKLQSSTIVGMKCYCCGYKMVLLWV